MDIREPNSHLRARAKTLSALVVSNILANLIVYCGLYVMSQMVAPGEFGIYATVAALGMAMYPLMTFRYEQAIPLTQEAGEAQALYLLSLGLSVSISVISVFGLAIVLQWPAVRALLPLGLAAQAWWVILFAFSVATFGVLQSMAIRDNALHKLALFRVVRAVALAGLQIGAVLLITPTAGSILGAETLANIALTLMLVLSLGGVAADLKTIRWDRLQSQIPIVMRKFKSFPLINLPHSVIHGALVAGYVTTLGVLYGAAALGNYFMMQRIVFSATGLLSTALYQQGLAETARKSPEELRRAVHGIAALLLGVGTLAAATLLLFGEAAFSFALGPEWVDAGMFATASVARIVMEPIASALAFVPMILSKQRQAFAWAVGQGVVALGVLAIAHALGASATLAVAVSSTALACVLVVYLVWIDRSVRRNLI